MKEILQEAEMMPNDRYTTVSYERLVNNPLDIFDQVLSFCGLEMTERITWYIESLEIQNMNYKWEQDYKGDDISLVEKILSKHGFGIK